MIFRFKLRCLRALGIVALLAIVSSVLTRAGESYIPPAHHRADVVLASNWRFLRQDIGGAQNPGFDDSNWQPIALPHTWNNLDGQDGGTYYRGVGWYRAHVVVDNAHAGRRLFLKFDGAFLVADVYVNGFLLGQHQGGFAAFVFDATPYLNAGADNVIAVKVSNAANADIPPLSADFTFFGGIYRDVHLLVTDPVQVSPLDYGSPGVYLRTTSVSSNSAALQVTTVLSNAAPAGATVTVRTIVADADTNIVAVLTNVVSLPPASASNVVAATTVAAPHLWNGLAAPYLYQVYVEVWTGGTVVDVVSQPLGFRYFSVDPNNGFSLNGRPYDLHGVNMHQDWLDCGWALTNAQRVTNFLLLKELGATAVRLSHYEHHDETYDLADRHGIVLWSEVPNINAITATPAYYSNTLQQLREMIRQRGNHPSVMCWGLYNEITLQSGPSPSALISQEAQLAAQEDPTRPTTAASNSSDNDQTTQYSTLICFNKYYGWYGGVLSDLGPWADNFHATYPARMVGVSEYGCGASISQHSEEPVLLPANAGPYHPEEYQNLYHESYWQQMKARPYLWGKFIWNMFDFAVDGRNEGDTPGRNDKGLVTYDRQVRKDTFYWYKANWTADPMVYITGHTFTQRQTNVVTARVYANCDSVELFVNGSSQGARTSTNCLFTWPLRLNAGTNHVTAIGTKGASNVTDSLSWVVPLLPPTVAITNPVTPTVFLPGTNALLTLAASADDNQPELAPAMTTGWAQNSGPGGVAFGDATALSTTAAFSSNGVYTLAFQAAKGALASTSTVTVVVGNVPYGPALKLRFGFDDGGNGTTTPSDTSAGGASVSLQMVSRLAAATNLHGAANSGVAGLTTGGRALNLAANPTQGGSGNFAAVTNAALGFGTVTNFTVTLWFKQSAGLPANIGPRLFLLGNSTNADCGTANSIGMKFQDAANLYFFVNTAQATAAFAANLPTNSWVFVAMVYDGNNIRLYQGTDAGAVKLAGSATAAGLSVPLSPGAASLFLGNRLARDRAFAGWIDDFRFYTGAGDSSFVESVRQAAAGPGGLSASPGTNRVTLNWTPLLGATGYFIKRAASSGGPYLTLGTAPGGAVSYVDLTAVGGTAYFYTVSAATEISPAPETANSPNEAAATPFVYVPPAPFNIASRVAGGRLILDWPVGVLESATNLAGPWTAVNGAATPFTNAMSEAAGFFRVKAQ
jgi:beta-galactosidase